MTITQKDKELLLKDLCGRLPYGVKVQYNNEIYNIDYISALYEEVKLDIPDNYTIGISEIKPYLRPMSSMTEKEKWDFGRIFNSFSYLKLELLENGLSFHEIYDITGMCDITWNELNTAIDWLNAHHFDYRGLIPMGLALEAPNEIYNN